MELLTCILIPLSLKEKSAVLVSYLQDVFGIPENSRQAHGKAVASQFQTEMKTLVYSFLALRLKKIRQEVTEAQQVWGTYFCLAVIRWFFS